jgi:hypothetical protein
MYGGQNQFLNSFMKMRAELNTKKGTDEMPKSGRPMPEVPKKGKVISLRSIIEDKPKTKVVVEFFRTRVGELEAEAE